jgi:hypothetical protein
MHILLAIVALALTPAQSPHDLDHRGEAVMGFDQTATAHHFRLRPDGGDIQVTARNPDDATSAAQIRMHLEHLAQMFTNGNFDAPMLVHGKIPPGVDGMKKAGAGIQYSYAQVPAGGVVRLRTTSREGLEAVHAFLRFQIQDHKTGDPLTVSPR